MTNRNVNLDLIKCIACFAVVGLHAVGMNNYTIYYLCGCGVPLFFMVNGYLLFSKEQLPYTYIFRKILQILKIVLLWNLLIALPVLVIRHKIVNPLTLSFSSLLQKGYLWHFWFFGALLLLYLILPPLHKLFHKKRGIHVLTVILCFFLCLSMSITSMVKGYPLHAYIPQSLRLWTWLFYFAAGGLFAHFGTKLFKFPLLLHTAFMICAALLNNRSLKHIGLYFTQSRIADYYYDYLSSVIYYLLLFTLLLRIPLKQAAHKAIAFLSSLTMGIFILHPIFLMGINAFYTPDNKTAAIILWVLLTFASALVAFIMSKLPLIKELIKLS
ncbi:MAG: acyltransferase [Lachnospiraceae bacterium]|nr:acyltransferase [Lachnospiraceae bacterium]